MFDSLNWPKDVPKDFYFEAMEAMHRQRIKDLKAARVYHQSMGKIKSEYVNKLHALIGSDKLKRYQKLHNARIRKLRKTAAAVPSTAEQLKEREALRLELVEKSQREIDKSGVDLKKVTKLRDACEKKAASLFERTLGKGNIGEAIPRPNNYDYYPPYLLDAREFEHYESEASLPNPSVTRYLNDSTGEVGSRTRIHVRGADEWDLVTATCRNGFLLIYRSPTTGVPAVNFDVEVIDVNYSGFIRNECGRSDASVRQLGRLFAQVYTGSGPADRTYCPAAILNVRHSGREDSWSNTIREPGDDIRYSFRLPTPLRADQLVLVGVGVETYNNFLSNDCQVDSTIEVRLFARHIGLTTTD